MEKFTMPTTVVIGRDSVIESRGAFAGIGKKAAIVTGRRSALASGALNDVTFVLETHDIGYTVISDINNNPDLENVKEAAEKAKKEEADFIIGIGGGSPLDAAKAVAALCTNEIETQELFSAEALNDPLPIIAIPTTAGTGSEVTPYAVLTVSGEKTKKTFTDFRIFPRYAFLDHKYTFSLGKEITTDTAVDFFTHAFEGYISMRATRTSDILAIESMRIFFGSYDALLTSDIKEETREQLLYGSMLAGMVISQTGTTALHGLGYELTCNREISHGRANGLLFPAYYNELLEQRGQKIRALVETLGMSSVADPAEKIKRLIFEKIEFDEGEAELYAANGIGHKSIRYTPAALDHVKILRIFNSVRK